MNTVFAEITLTPYNMKLNPNEPIAMSTQNFKDMPKKHMSALIRLRLRNQNFEPVAKITRIVITDTGDYRFSAMVYSDKYKPETTQINLKSKMFVNEFLYLQKLGYDLTHLNTEQ